MDAFEQVKNSGKSIKKFANAEVVINSKDKGLRMMNFVHDLQVYNNPEKRHIYLRACCWASYKRNIKYKVKLVLNQNEFPKILAAKCDRQCPASNSGVCCHVMALIWKLEDMTRKSELRDFTPDNRCCTSKPRQWGKGNKREVEFHPVMASNVIKPRHSSDLPGRKRRGVQSQFYDPRPPKSRKLDVTGIVKLKRDLQNINPNIPFAAMLPEEKSISTVMTLVGTVAKGSTIHKQLQDYATPGLIPTSISSNRPAVQVNWSPVCSTSDTTEELRANHVQREKDQSLNGGSPGPSITHVHRESAMPHTSEPHATLYGQPNGNAHLQEEEVSTGNTQGQEQAIPIFANRGADPYHTQAKQTTQAKTLFIETLTDEQQRIEMATRGQSLNPTWFEQKQNRITASICKDVFTHMQNKGAKIPENLIKRIISKGILYKHVSYSQAKHLNYKSKGMIYGIENEPVAAILYKEYLLSLPDIKEVTIQEVGLILDRNSNVLAASPDRIATIVYYNGTIEHRNVEIKCLESKQDVSPEVAIEQSQKEASFPFTKNNSFYEVKDKHKYWFQTQMQMGISTLPLTDFVIFTSSRYPILVLKVTFSSRWSNEIKPSLLAFHKKYIANNNS